MATAKTCSTLHLSKIDQARVHDDAQAIMNIDASMTFDDAMIEAAQDIIAEFKATKQEVLAEVIKLYEAKQTTKANIIGKGNTGDVVRIGDEAVKNSTNDEAKGEENRTLLETHKLFNYKLYSGDITADELKASFENLVANKDAVYAELNKLTKDVLAKKYIRGYVRSDETKADFVHDAYMGMLADYKIADGMISYGMGKDSYLNAISKFVDGTTNADIKDYAGKIAQAESDRAVRKADILAGIDKPVTVDDFGRIMQSRINENKSNGMSPNDAFNAARMEFSQNQREQYDNIVSEMTRSKRSASKATQQSRVSVPGDALGASEIIKTKHTKLGHDLWQFDLERRVDRDEFKALVEQAKRLGGNYSSYRGGGAIPGWQFRLEESAKAFKALIAGDATEAKKVMQVRHDAFADDLSKSAVERLNEMADRLEGNADESLGRNRKANTRKRAGEAARAEGYAQADKAMAVTMRNIATAIQNGTAKLLDRVRQKTQVEMLQSFVHTAQYDKIKKAYPAYIDQQRHGSEKPNSETADYATFPSYSSMRSDLASLARNLINNDGTKNLGTRLMKVADDTSAAYQKFAKENLMKVSVFSTKGGSKLATFASKMDADEAIRRSGFNGKAVVFAFKRGDNRIILSPSEAISRGIWKGDDKLITLSPSYGAELTEKIGKSARRGNKVSVPWQFENAYEKRKRLVAMGIETPAEFRAALREFIALREAPKEADKIKEMERAMVGRANDGLDFFPTPAGIVDQMIETADIKPGMSVLEPSAGMGHIAERIREFGNDPDVVEMSNSRKDLLEAKGFNVVGRDFMDIKPREFFTFGDTFKADNGTIGVMHGGIDQLGSPRVVLRDNEGNALGFYDRSELTGIKKNGVDSGYDRIIMNPPFGDRRDAEHVYQAFELLKPGGRIVAIMGEGVFFGNDKKAVAFRDWLDKVGGTEEKLAEGTFNDPSLPVTTGTNTRMVVIDKSESDVKFSKSTPTTGSTVAEVTEWLPRRVKRMVESGKLKVVQSAQEAIDAGVMSFNAGNGIEGFYNQNTDQLFLIADSLDKSNLNAVLSHELLHRGLSQDPKLKAAYERFKGNLQGRFNLAYKGIGTATDKAAYARVIAAETPLKDQLEEFSSYMISEWQKNPESVSSTVRKAIADFVATIRAFLIRNGLDLGYIKSLTPADLAAMSKYGAKVLSNYSENPDKVFNKAVTSNQSSNDIRFSRSAPITNAVAQGDDWLRSHLNQSRKDSLIYNLQDRFIDLKREIEKAIENGGTVGEKNNPYMAEELYPQRIAARIKEFYTEEVNPLLNDMHDKAVSKDQLEEFAHARHAPSRNAEMAERNPNQDMIDSRLTEAETNLDEVRSYPIATRKKISEALDEYNKWNSAKPFNGSEEDRLALSGMSDEESLDYMSDLTNEQRSTLTAMGDKLDAINNKTLDLLVEYGMETEESVKILKEQWEHYVPLHRDEAHPDDNNFGHPVGRGFSVSGSGMQSATGSTAEVTNILAHIIAAREQMLRRGEKNIVTKALAAFIRANPDPDFAEINKMEVDKALNDYGLVESRVEPAFKRNMADNVVMYRVDGKNKAIVFNDSKHENIRLALSLKNLDGVSLDVVESIIAKGTRWFAKVNTQYNVVFGVVNLIRDTQGMMLNLSSTELHGKQLDVLKNMKDAFKAIYQEGRTGADPALQVMYKRFNLAGGTTGYGQMFDDIRDRNKSIEKELKKLGNSKPMRIAHQLFDSLSLFNDLMENSTRLAVFMTAVNSGMSDAKAASLAKNITVNFNRKGAQSTKIGAFYAFFNPSAQGTARLVETMNGPKGKQILAGGVSLGVLTTLMGLVMMGDDEWEKIPEFVRERSLIIPTGGSNYISIPMPLGFHLLPNIGRKLTEAAFGSNRISTTRRLTQLAGSTIGAFNPLGGSDISEFIMPTVLDPALALWRNKDWTGRSIYKEDFNSLSPTPGFTRAKDTSSTLSKLITEGINKVTGGTDYKQGAWSPTPDQIDYIFGQLMGGTGREIMKLEQSIVAKATGEELPLYKVPLVGRFAGETSGNAAERGLYYENIKIFNEHEAEMDGLKKDHDSAGILAYTRDNPEVKLLSKVKDMEKVIAKLKKRRSVMKGINNKGALKSIDNLIAGRMKALNDAILAAD